MKFAHFLFVFFLVLGCATSPTGRKQLLTNSESRMDQMGRQAFSQLKSKSRIERSGSNKEWVSCTTREILMAMGENPSSWEVQVFMDDSPNAFALPGKKIGVHTGMTRLAGDTSELAAVIGHEIGHVLANHGNERMSQAQMAQVGLTVAELALGNDSQTDQLILAGLGVGAQVGVLMPFSRTHEKEADLLGLDYLVKAGYDPNGSVRLWNKMAKLGGSTPEFLSTHPASKSRARYLQARIEKMNWQLTNTNCPKP